MLIRLYLFQYILVFVLSVEIKCPDHLLEQVHVNDLVALASGEPLGVIKEHLEGYLLIFKDFSRLQMFLSHVRLSIIGGLITRHQIEVEHELIILIVRGQCHLRAAVDLCLLCSVAILVKGRLHSFLEGLGPPGS
jgi:hypothetical protein